MDEATLKALLCDLESDLVERKQSLSDKDKIRRAICAFANDLPNHNKPGVIFVGVKDDGACAKLSISDQLLLTLSDLRSQGGIHPFPSIDVRRETVDGCECVCIYVHPSKETPIRIDNTIYVRVGGSTRVANAEDERRLIEKRKSGDAPYDIHPISSATLGDIDKNYFLNEYLPLAVSREVINENSRTFEDKLSSVRFVTAQKPPVPTTVGILTACNDPLQFFPGAYIQFTRIAGSTLSDPIKDQKEISGPLVEALRTLDELIKINISVSSSITSGPVETKQPDYPSRAIEQIIRNAILHRNYEGTNAPIRFYWFDGRIEIHSPGGPYGAVTEHNFGEPHITDYRNPNIAEVMKNLGYVQKFGAGIELCRKLMNDNGNPKALFEAKTNYVLVTLKSR